MYEKLAESGVDTHVYGIRDEPDTVDELDLAVHGGMSQEYRRSWVVAFRPETDDGDHVALIALEVGPNVWRSVWTYDPDLVDRICKYIRERF